MASDLERLVPGCILRDRLEMALLCDGLEWIAPHGVLDGVDIAYGLPVRHVTGTTTVYLAHCLEADRD